MRFVYKFLLSLNSIMLFGFFYSLTKVSDIKSIGVPLVWLGISLLIAGLCIVASNWLSREMITGGIQAMELANETYLPVYLGYFFVALGINNTLQFIIVAVVIFLFLYASQTACYNPLLHLFGFRFYQLTRRGEKILIISRRKLHYRDDLSFCEIRRINDYTFIDMEKREK